MLLKLVQNHRTTELQNYRTTELQNYRTTELQNYRTTAEKILSTSMSAYRIEAELIGASDFPPLNETVEDILSSQNHFFGFIKNESLIGVIEIEEAESHSIISRLVVCPSVFRQGIASQLLRSCLNSDTDYQVTTAENNLPAISLYKRFGFLESETYSTPDLSVKLITLNRSVKLSVNESYEAGIQ